MFWIWSVHQHARNRLSGAVTLSLLLPLLAVVLALLKWYLEQELNESSLYYLGIIDDGRLYNGLLFDVWQLWSHVFYFDGLWHFLVNLLFFLPLAFYWERHFKLWFPLALCILLPASVFMLLMLVESPPALGTSLLIYGLCGGLLMRDRLMRVELLCLRWWATQITLRKQSLLLLWLLLLFALLDVGRSAWQCQDLILLMDYIVSALCACCAGGAVFRLLSQARIRLELTSA